MEPTDDPFGAMDRLLPAHKLGRDVDAIIVDFHCEATGEKQAMGHFCDGRVESRRGYAHRARRVLELAPFLPAAQPALTDVGIAGGGQFPLVGMQKEEPVRRFATGVTFGRFLPVQRARRQCAVSLWNPIPATGLATCIAPVRLGWALEQRTPAFWE